MSEVLDVPEAGIAEVTREDRLLAMLCHLGTFITWIPACNFVVPLAIWVIKRDQLPLVRDQGKEVLNFQISMFLYYAIGVALCFVLIGIPVLIALGLFHIVMSIVGAIKAYDGVAYRYPLTIRLL